MPNNIIIASITFEYNAKKDRVFVYWVSTKTVDSNDPLLPSSFNQSFKRLGLSTLLFMSMIKLCMVNNASGTTIYLQCKKNKRNNISFYMKNGFKFYKNEKDVVSSYFDLTNKNTWVAESTMALMICENKNFYKDILDAMISDKPELEHTQEIEDHFKEILEKTKKAFIDSKQEKSDDDNDFDNDNDFVKNREKYRKEVINLIEKEENIKVSEDDITKKVLAFRTYSYFPFDVKDLTPITVFDNMIDDMSILSSYMRRNKLKAMENSFLERPIARISAPERMDICENNFLSWDTMQILLNFLLGIVVMMILLSFRFMLIFVCKMQRKRKGRWMVVRKALMITLQLNPDGINIGNKGISIFQKQLETHYCRKN